MARHRKIDVRMWGDDKFRTLSTPKPCAQFLWVYLLTGPHTTSLPGLFNIGEAALAESLGWPLEGFRKAFQEVKAQGMAKADWKARVVWIPKAVEYNLPESPNVIKSWRVAWDEIPECKLKEEAYVKYQQALAASKAFAEAFREGIREPRKRINEHPSRNQEQEQEQEQEQDFSSPASPSSESTRSPKTSRPRDLLFDAVAEVAGADPALDGDRIGKVCAKFRKANPRITPEEVRALPAAIAARGWDFTLSVEAVGKHIGLVRAAPPPKANGPPGDGHATVRKTTVEHLESIGFFEDAGHEPHDEHG